jgi:DNA-binding MarR family transcriptional regulator/L-amino acid N-acyltransferase YncA
MKDLSITAINELRHNARSMVRELGLLNDAYFEIGVTLAERHLLIELDGLSAPTMGEIAERLLLDKSTISRLISKAIKKGYITCITDEKDKRKRFLQLTEFGKQILQEFEPIAFNQTKQALLTLTTEEIKTVYQGIYLYAKGLRSSRTKEKADTKQSRSEADLNTDTEIESLSETFGRLNQMGYTLQLFNSEDERELYKIFREVVDSGIQFPYQCNSIEEFHRQFFTSSGQVYVCHNIDKEVIGGFYLRPNFSGKSSHIANAAYMIRDTYRGKGIGSLLIKASLQLAKDLGFRAMQFNMVLSQNTRAVKLYQRLGFNIVGILPEAVQNPDGSDQDGYVMYRKL